MPVLRCFSCGHETGDVQAHRDHDKGHFESSIMGNKDYLAQIAKDQADAQKDNA